MTRSGFAAALLLAALPARAQMEVRTAVLLPPSAGRAMLAPALTAPVIAPALTAPVLAPSLASLAAPALAAAPLAAAAPAPASALPPIEAHAAAMSGALSEFGKTDLKTASAAGARDAGESLMARALGGTASAPADEPVEAAASAGVPALLPRGGENSPRDPKIYLLSKPLREKVRFGPVSIGLHVAYSVLWEATKAFLAYKATHSVAATAMIEVFELAASPAMATARSLADLGFRYWRRKLGLLKELARTPGVSRVKVLTTAEVSFAGPIARSADNTGLIFVESADELPEQLGRFGAPLALGDVGSSRVRLVFIQGGETSSASWTPTLKELLEGKPIPPEIAAAWRAGAGGSKPKLAKMIDVTGAKGKARLEATLIGADGQERDIGAISEGPAARKLIGLGYLDRARAFLGRALPSRSIPISDSVIERPGDARETGFVAGLRRAWRRVTGRLIVAR